MALVIAQISDLHCGSPLYDPLLLQHAVDEILDLEPDLVLVAGDLTQEGYAFEFQAARDALRPLQEAFTTIVIPGNHDAKNVGYVHFEDHFGKGEEGRADRVLHLQREGDPSRVSVVAVDSSRPDLAEGEVGRGRYPWIREQFSTPSDYRIFALHHHLVPVPGTGRERNIVWDAGDLLELLELCEVDMVLCGHKHVPHVWNLGRMLIVNSGTVSSYRTRGYTRPSYNVVTVGPDRVEVTLVYPGAGERPAAVYDRVTGRLERNPELAGMFSKEGWTW
ncbi:MAG: 3',5'-cyclic-nucleotide phosphodiesterase [Acidimicrobiia bacterium]|jgi:3',5'-cyclic AMP phosphodiesterase CpdA|nr:MAG: 3',5'-cyclic-nucleotide phosphodiesterase [Acidimicrobiia bacterium]